MLFLHGEPCDSAVRYIVVVADTHLWSPDPGADGGAPPPQAIRAERSAL